MKEVTHEDWMKNPIPRMMWVWDNIESVREKLKVLYILSKEEYPISCFRVIALTNEDSRVVRRYAHCAEIEKQRRMTNKELSRWLRENPTRECKCTFDNYIYSVHTYDEDCKNEEVYDVVIREDDGEWREPLVEVKEK